LCSVVASCTSLSFAGVIFVFAPQVAGEYLKAPHIAEQLRIAALYIFFVTLNGYQAGALAGFEAFSILAKINLIHGIVSLMLTFVLTLLWGLTGAASALGLAALFNWVLHQIAIRREVRRYGIRIKYSGFWQEKDILARFTFPAALSSIIGAFTVWSCNAFLTRQPDGLTQMAIFSAANNFRSFILFVPGLVSHVASPILCNLIGEKKQSSYSRLFWINIAASAAASIAVAIILVLAAPYVLELFGKGFKGGDSVAMVIVVMTVVEVMANAFYRSLFAHGKQWWQVQIIICWSLALWVVTFTTVGEYGAVGLAYAYLVAHVVSLSLYAFVTFKLQKMSVQTVTKEATARVFTE
jgi:O-antigen/teichoic acid export membrane protein